MRKRRTILNLLFCFVLVSGLLATSIIFAHADESAYNAVLDLEGSGYCTYYPGYNKELSGGTPGKLEDKSKLRLIQVVKNSKGNEVAYCYSPDLDAYVFIRRSLVRVNNSQKDQLEEGLYVISPKCATNSALDVTDWGISDGTNIQLWEKTGEKNQVFYVKPMVDGTYIIESYYCPGKVLDVAGGKKKNKTNIQLYSTNDTKAQVFRLESTNDEYFQIVSALNEKYVLDVANAGKENGTNIWLYEKNGTDAQLFSFEEVFGLESYAYENVNYNVLPNFSDYVYDQRDYDRFLNSAGRNVGCTATALATAYSIKHPEKAITPNSKSIQWTSGVGVTWTTHCKWLSETEYLSSEERMEMVYEFITKESMPVILRLDKKSGSGGHSVVVVGVKEGVDKDLSAKDFLVIDPWGGKIRTLKESMGNSYTVSVSWALIIPKE